MRGCDKTVFASDFPLLDLAIATRDARVLTLDSERLEQFLFANGDRLFWQ